MFSYSAFSTLTFSFLFSCVYSSPRPAPTSKPQVFQQAILDIRPARTTPPPRLDPTRTHNRRGVISDIDSYAGSILSEIDSNLPSWAISGILPVFESFPTGAAVQSSLSLQDSDVAALPTQALNLPPYGNWTDQGWNIRIHGNIYKVPNISESKLDDLANVFLGNTSIQSLPPSQQAQARNVTAEIFVIQQGNVQPLFSFAPTPTSGVAVVQTMYAPFNTTPEGDYDTFTTLNMDGLAAGNATTSIQQVPMYVNGTDSGNATAYLVPPQGMTIISDIDDILRVTKIYEPEQGLLDSFARPFTPWMNMPDIYANWSKTFPYHFHYLTTTPEQITRNYESFIFANYPAGSFDTRPLNFSNPDETLSVRMYMLQKIFATFPQRKFILIADTSNSDVMKDYPSLAHTTDQVACILLRNTSADDAGDKFPYDTSGFKGLNQSQFMFFYTPDDLTGLDFARGDCHNSTIGNLSTYGYQNLPEGLSISSSDASPGWRSNTAQSWVFAVLAGLVAVVAVSL